MDVTNESLANEVVNAVKRIGTYVCKTATQESLYLSQLTGAKVYFKMGEAYTVPLQDPMSYLCNISP